MTCESGVSRNNFPTKNKGASGIRLSIALGLSLFSAKYRQARRVTQLPLGMYMLLYLRLACNENMQIEGFWYHLFSGVFEAATIHYAVAKTFGPPIFGRGWCGHASWTAMVLDFLPYRTPARPGKRLDWIRYIVFAASLTLMDGLVLAHVGYMERIVLSAFTIGNPL